ncbi:hypothetical protein PSTG_08915 [Puccinia striiformis f. sp. tritici PST-78]|uniref:Uncharacterized protein n=1 Tax=Puccinia striiformis f. sp. tritici PST-78 TaxID=1165861 RepID=A0A0L0VF54_9BASI|nr:hypothetical protein PSTG_08915 [Puccinia striiformis f. sp. tritici PST-78]
MAVQASVHVPWGSGRSAFPSGASSAPSRPNGRHQARDCAPVIKPCCPKAQWTYQPLSLEFSWLGERYSPPSLMGNMYWPSELKLGSWARQPEHNPELDARSDGRSAIPSLMAWIYRPPSWKGPTWR